MPLGIHQESFSHFVVYTKSWLAEQTTPVALLFEDKVRRAKFFCYTVFLFFFCVQLYIFI